MTPKRTPAKKAAKKVAKKATPDPNHIDELSQRPITRALRHVQAAFDIRGTDEEGAHQRNNHLREAIEILTQLNAARGGYEKSAPFT